MHHILKGGEDSIGALEAIQRVYFNIGSCSEQCWTNHLTDLRQLDPQGRNFGQTPFIIGQCRRDCPNFRAIEDRLPNILAFLESKETDATDLAQARETALQKASTPAKPGTKPKAAYSTTQSGARSQHPIRPECRRARARGLRRDLRALSLVDSRYGRRRLQEPRLSRNGTDRNARRLDGFGPGDAGIRGRHESLPCACTRIT